MLLVYVSIPTPYGTIFYDLWVLFNFFLGGHTVIPAAKPLVFKWLKVRRQKKATTTSIIDATVLILF